jgi:hypothetical protein
MKLSELLEKLRNPALRTGQAYVEGPGPIRAFLQHIQYAVPSGHADGLGLDNGFDEGDGGAGVELPILRPFLLELSSSKLSAIDRLQDSAWVRSCFLGAASTDTGQCVALLARVNALKSLKFCATAPQLRLIDASHNYLTNTQGAAACAAHLRLLDVSGNLLRSLSFGGAAMARLTVLRASHNKIATVEGLAACSSLRELDLSHNALVGDIAEGLFPVGVACKVLCVFAHPLSDAFVLRSWGHVAIESSPKQVTYVHTRAQGLGVSSVFQEFCPMRQKALVIVDLPTCTPLPVRLCAWRACLHVCVRVPYVHTWVGCHCRCR